MDCGFKLQGNVSGAVRSDDEMSSINKEIAEKAFKTHKKELDTFMKENGFLKHKTNSYIRKNKIDVLEYFDLQKEHYGSKTMTANYALIPLYVPHEFLSFDLGNRLGMLICGRDVWWDYSDDNAASVSFGNIIRAAEEFLLPWFEERTSVDLLRQELIKEKNKRENYGGRLSSIQQMWLELLEKDTDRRDIILKNMEVMKLPAKIL